MMRIFLVFFFTSFISKIIGVVREVIFAHILGTTQLADIVRFSFNYCVFIVHLFTMDAFYNVFVPYFKKTQDFVFFRFFFYLVSTIFITLIFLTIFFSKNIFYFAKINTFNNEVVLYSFLPFLFFYFLFVILTGLELSTEKYLFTSLRPLIQNLGFIIGLLAYAFSNKPFLIGLSVSLCFLIAIVVYLLSIKKRTIGLFFFGKIFPVKIEKNVIYNYINIFSFQLLWNFNFMYENIVAGRLGSGEITGLSYVKTLIETLLILLSIPLSNVFLAKYESDIKKDKKRLYKAVSLCFLTGVVISLIFLFFRNQILSLLFFHGKFNVYSLKICERYLFSYSFGIFAYLNFFLFQRFLGLHNFSDVHLKIGAISQIFYTIGLIFLPQFLGAYAIGFSFSFSQILYFLLAWNKVRNI